MTILCLSKNSGLTFSENLPTASAADSLTFDEASVNFSTTKVARTSISSLIGSRQQSESEMYPKK